MKGVQLGSSRVRAALCGVVLLLGAGSGCGSDARHDSGDGSHQPSTDDDDDLAHHERMGAAADGSTGSGGTSGGLIGGGRGGSGGAGGSAPGAGTAADAGPEAGATLGGSIAGAMTDAGASGSTTGGGGATGAAGTAGGTSDAGTSDAGTRDAGTTGATNDGGSAGGGTSGGGTTTGGMTGGSASGGGTGGGGASFDVLQLGSATSAISVASDASGRMHVAFVSSTSSVISYASCAENCGTSGAWSAVALVVGANFRVPTLGVTRDGRPRIHYASITGEGAGDHYLECDHDCLTQSSWSDLQLNNVVTAPDPVATLNPPPRATFAVSPSGHAAFFYEAANQTSSSLLWCEEDCLEAGSWVRTLVLGAHSQAKSLVFGPDDTLHLARHEPYQDGFVLGWVGCRSGCGDPANYQVSEPIVVQGVYPISAALAGTAQGGVRLAFLQQAPLTMSDQASVVYAACDANCEQVSSWTHHTTSFKGDVSKVGMTLLVDTANRPLLAMAGLFSAGVSRCSASCGSASDWSTPSGMTSAQLAQLFPAQVPGCAGATWQMYAGPNVALDAAQKPRIAFSSQLFTPLCGVVGYGGFTQAP